MSSDAAMNFAGAEILQVLSKTCWMIKINCSKSFFLIAMLNFVTYTNFRCSCRAFDMDLKGFTDFQKKRVFTIIQKTEFILKISNSCLLKINNQIKHLLWLLTLFISWEVASIFQHWIRDVQKCSSVNLAENAKFLIQRSKWRNFRSWTRETCSIMAWTWCAS